ncbi:MAG TPA: FAD-binding protein [Burkholderiaceae bacterium]|nr:FAD-binding protein [Burkholderiaceae bacterium]
MRALVLAEHDNASLKAATRNVVTAAIAAAGQADVLVVGSGCSAAAQQAGAIAGVSKVYVADAPHFADALAENVSAQLFALAGNGYTHVMAPASSFGKNVLPRVAARMDCAQISDAIEVIAPDTFARPIYAGNAIATVQCADPVIFVTVRPTSFASAADGGNGAIETVLAVPDEGISQFVGREIAKSDRPELQGAKVVISGGRALGSAENFQLLDRLARRLNAALGASRAAVDAGYAPNDWQVGQTGKIVAPQLYIAIGISGAIQHLAGMKDSKVIVAINKDADAPIFQVADYGLVADLFQAVPELIEKLG